MPTTLKATTRITRIQRYDGDESYKKQQHGLSGFAVSAASDSARKSCLRGLDRAKRGPRIACLPLPPHCAPPAPPHCATRILAERTGAIGAFKTEQLADERGVTAGYFIIINVKYPRASRGAG